VTGEPVTKPATKPLTKPLTKEGKKKGALAWLRTALALALLAFGAWLVPWSDRLEWIEGGKTIQVSGEIRGNWRANTVGFVADPGESAEGAWPSEVGQAIAASSEITVTRPADGTVPDPKIGRLDWKPGMLRVFRDVEPSGLWSALGLIFAAALVAITRWWRLLAIAGCGTRWTSALRLSFLGFFFNLVLPAGITGGDVIKAVLVVREHPDRRADAFVTVVVDRALGLLVLMALAAAIVVLSGDRFAELKLPVVLAFVAALLALWALLHPGPRRWLRLSALLERLPQRDRLKAIAKALQIYAEHPFELGLAMGLSCINHLCIGGSVYMLGHAFGDDLSYLEYIGVAAIANTISSVPVTPAGWGVGEWAFGSLFHVLGSPSTLGVAVSVAYRLLTAVPGLVGGMFLLLPGGRGVRREIEETQVEGGAAPAERP
jgi:uncharacterized protein (TIRG00374 family)